MKSLKILILVVVFQTGVSAVFAGWFESAPSNPQSLPSDDLNRRNERGFGGHAAD
jgi:hypothetical protein